MTILIKFHKDRTKIVAKFWACALFSLLYKVPTYRIMKSIKRTNLTMVSQTLRLLTCSMKVNLGGRVDLLLDREELESDPAVTIAYSFWASRSISATSRA